MKTVSLVLGSGGARGYAHIGVIEELLKNGFEITSISGSSMGALIGGLYACGKLDSYKKWVEGLSKIDVLKLLDISFNAAGFIKGERVFKNLEELFEDRKIEGLPIKFTAVATNLTTKKEFWFQKGSLADAVRASISIPTIFTPKSINGDLYLDGGVINPLPVAPTLSDISDYTISVNLNADIPNIYEKKVSKKQENSKTKESSIFAYFNDKIKKNENSKEKLGYFKIMQASINIMQTSISRYKNAEYTPDIKIDIPLGVCDFYEFYLAKEVIEVGKEATRKALAEHF